MRTIEELQKLLEIDKNNLELELVEQPQLFWEVSEGFAQAASKRDTAKHIAEIRAAEIANIFRGSSVEKVTESKVEQHITSHPSYIEQYKFYLDYKAETERWEALKNAYAQRCSMLRDLISLHSTGYWGSGISQDTQNEQIYAQKYKERGAK